MSKLDEAIALIMEDHGELSNAEIAKRIGCDEGIVRRARKEVHVVWLESEIARLNAELEGTRAELARYRRATLPPRRDRGSARTYPLLGEQP